MAVPSRRPCSSLYAASTSGALTVQIPAETTDFTKDSDGNVIAICGVGLNSVIVIDDENLIVTALTAATPASTLTVTRGANQTAAASHLINAPVSALVPATIPFVPLQSAAEDASGNVSRPWIQFFQTDWTLSGVTSGTYGNNFAVAQLVVNDRGRITAAATVPIVIPNSGVTAGTYGDASHVSHVTVGADGRITAISSVAISLVATGVTAGTYGDSGHVGTFTVGFDGRLAAAANVAITLPAVGPGAGTYTTGARLTPTGSDGAISIDAQGRVTGITPAS